MKKRTTHLFTIGLCCYLLSLLLPLTAYSQCDCTEYVYLNEPTTNGAVHKYRINADNTFTEIGTPWFDNAVAGAGLNSPHGLA
ncbi:MAG: hypothetical protein AAGJ82_04270, partial [Bacteroidota bacterium]